MKRLALAFHGKKTLHHKWKERRDKLKVQIKAGLCYLLVGKLEFSSNGFYFLMTGEPSFLLKPRMKKGVQKA